jgi:hypothetical protein
MSTIEDLTQKRDILRDKLKDAEEKLRKAKIEACPVKVGDVVISKVYGEARVMEVEPKEWGLWLRGVPRNKDGEWSRRVLHLYSHWTIPEES